jgi:hypothetical protein
VILADSTDPYYPLAEEMARKEALPVVGTLDDALEREPVYVLWVVSPDFLSDQAMIDSGRRLRDRTTAISVGIITGTTLSDAKDLWLRAPAVRGERIVAARAANPSAHISAGIVELGSELVASLPLTRMSLLRSLQSADYLTFAGHGGSSYLAIEKGNSIKRRDIPALGPAVMATSSCNTLRPWEDESIALALTDSGAAAYAGFVYSPTGGYLMGAYEGAPFRHTWPEFPIGHAVQVQNRGTLRGFAHLPYYWLLGDPRISLQDKPPYRVKRNESSGSMLTLELSSVPSGVIPIHIPDGGRYDYVELPGTSSASNRDLFYNARLQAMDIGEDKFVLADHDGGDVTLRLRTRPPWGWVIGDTVIDALDGALVFLPQTEGQGFVLVLAVAAVLFVARLVRRRRPFARAAVAAAAMGLAFALLHGLYAFGRADQVDIVSKPIEVNPLSFVVTVLSVGCGAFLYANAASAWERATAVLVAGLPVLAPTVTLLSVLAFSNLVFFRPRLGTNLYNYTPALQPLVALTIEWLLFGLIFRGLRAGIRIQKLDASTS